MEMYYSVIDYNTWKVCNILLFLYTFIGIHMCKKKNDIRFTLFVIGTFFLSSIHRKDEKIFSDKLISLHINANERLSFISQYFDSNTKILLGHYDPKTNISKYCENHNLDYIKKGMNFYGKQ
jgi:hypothetical protein